MTIHVKEGPGINGQYLTVGIDTVSIFVQHSMWNEFADCFKEN